MVFIFREVPNDQGSSAHDVSIIDQTELLSFGIADLPQ